VSPENARTDGPVADAIQALSELGFTGAEAEVYAFLLQESPATGYRVAQALRKPAANVYKAIESLQAKGAVLVDDGASRHIRPVAPDQLLRQLARAFDDRRVIAAGALAQIRADPEDDRVYQLTSREQVVEKARSLVMSAQQVVLVDAFPGTLEEIRADLEAAIARDVAVAVHAYAPVDLPGAAVAFGTRGAATMARWPGDWLNVLADGREVLWALLERGRRGVLQAIWTQSPYLAWVPYSGIHAEIVLTAVTSALESGADAAAIRTLVQDFERFIPLHASGYERLMSRYGGIGANGRPGAGREGEASRRV